MNSLIKTTIKRPVTICVLVVILLAVGVLSTLDMSTNLLPNIKMPMLGVTAIYPGAAASSVQTDVTDKLENVFKTIPGITELDTRSYDNVSVCVLTFDYGTDIDGKIDDIEDALKTVTLPQGCNEPTFSKIDMNGTAAATISLYNDKDDIELLAAEADLLSTKLRAIEGVGSVSVMGKPEKQIQITALQGLDITALAVVQALQQENLNLPLGTILQNGAVVSVRNASDATSMLQIMQLPVSMDLGESALGSLAAVKSAVKTYANCTLDEFNDYVSKALDARRVIDEIEGKTSAELEEQYDSLTSLKSLMTLVRENSSQSLKLMWHTIDTNLVQNDEFVNMSDDDLRALAENGNLNLSYDVLKWLRDGASDGTLKTDWDKLVSFRMRMERAELADDIPYDHFANLFQNGGEVTYVTYDPDGTVIDTVTEQYEGLDILHSDVDHESCVTEGEGACDREVFTHGEAVDVCEFADSVNTVAYQRIIDAVKEAEENPIDANDPVISDELFAALFVNSTQGSDFAALMSPQVIHIIRLDNFNAEIDGKESIVAVLTEVKLQRVDTNGDAVYKNGLPVTFDEDDNVVVVINGVNYSVDGFGRLIDNDGNLVDEQGNVITLTDEQKENNYYAYGLYRVFDDGELIDLYSRLGLDGDSFGIDPTLDVVRFIRITDFGENVSALIVPVAYVGKVQTLTAYEAYSQYNGRLAVTLEVYAVSDANTTAVVNAVKNAMAQIDVSGNIVLLDDKAEFINDSITNVLTSIIIGGVLAVLVIYLFVGKIGSSLVVSITMPLSVLVALIGLWAMGISLNMVSLGGLAVGIGMLVDNSIVVLESITKRRDRGESVFDSCLNGTREVAGSLLASTLTNICVFFPILFAKGLTREIFYDLVWAVLFSIIMSLIVAVTVIPSLYHLIYNRSPRPRYKKDKNGNKVFVGNLEDNEPRGKSKPLYDEKSAEVKASDNKSAADNEQSLTAETVAAAQTDKEENKPANKRGKKKDKKPVDRAARKRSVLNRMENGYGKLLSKVLTQRVAVCVVALVVFAASVGLVFTTGTDFLPSVDKGVIEVNLKFGGAATLDEARDATKTAADVILQEYGDNLQFASYTVGKQGMLPMTITGVVRIQTDVNKLNTSKTVNDIRQLLSSTEIAATNISVSEIDGVVAELTGEMAGQSVTLMSDDMSKLASAANAVAQRLGEIEAIESVTDNTPETNDEISLVFDKDACARNGVDYQNAVLLLRVGMSGYTAATINVDDDSQNVNVIFDDYTKDTIEQLLNVIVGFNADGAVKISDVLQPAENGDLYTVNQVVTNINKLDGKYVTTIDVETYNVDMGTASGLIEKAVKEVLNDYPDVTYQEGGVAHYLSDAMNGLVISLIAAFLLLYGVMACQFESLVKPFIVIMSIPFSFTGGFLALVITGTTLNVVSFVGVIMLMGVIVNGAIVMIDKIDQLIKEGLSPQQAVLEGCKSRLRPILMTTLTTILALIPLALGLGRGGELMQPMGIVVIGGLLLGTLVTLVLIPCFYCIVKRIKFVSPKKPATSDGDGDETPDDNNQNESVTDEPLVGANQNPTEQA